VAKIIDAARDQQRATALHGQRIECLAKRPHQRCHPRPGQTAVVSQADDGRRHHGGLDAAHLIAPGLASRCIANRGWQQRCRRAQGGATQQQVAPLC
jgi:hypothetical protein